MKLFRISVTDMIIRFHLIMIIIVASGFAGQYINPALWFLSLLALPIFMSALLGIEIPKPYVVPERVLRHHPHPQIRITNRYHKLAH